MLSYNGPGFRGLYAGDTVEFIAGCEARRATVLPLLVFPDHVQVRYGACGFTVDAANFVRLVRRGPRHMAAIETMADVCATEYVRRHGLPGSKEK